MTHNARPSLSLLTAYRRRESHLAILLQWLARIRSEEQFTDFELILVEGDEQATVGALTADYDWLRYLHIPMSGPFHKTVLLNHAARLARGTHRMMFDVDLLPGAGALALHLSLAVASPRCLVSGYRVQLASMFEPASALPTSQEIVAQMDLTDATLLCPEDNPSALRKYLLAGERFGVCPCFPAALFDEVGGVEEEFVGWGCEDQDLIERVCATGMTLVRSPDLLYFHLPHERERDWVDAEMTARNRQKFAARRTAR